MSPIDTSVRFAREWDRLRRHAECLERAARWEVTTAPLEDLDVIIGLAAPASPAAEPTLRTIVALARDDELAARVALQCLLPDLERIRRRRRRQGWRDVDLGDLLTTGWTVIRTYNPRRRPVRLANALVSDIEYREYRAPLRRFGHGIPSAPERFDQLVDDRSPDAVVELARLLAEARAAGVPDDDLDLVRRLVSGRPAIDIARDLDVTPRTIRNRRDRIAHRLREVATAA